MNPVLAAHHVSKVYRHPVRSVIGRGPSVALDDVTFTIADQTIYGLLGRNGAGKTTLMQILTGQNFASSGRVELFGQSPYENDAALANVCFVKESQRYPDVFTVANALRAAALLFPEWDNDFALSLVEDFQLPPRRRVSKLSRGMRSALGVIIGLAARSRITLFDEPYLGLDAVGRQLFYDRLLRDYADHPRTVILSTHLIDEVSALIEHVLLLDRGRLIVDAETESLREQMVTVTGPVSTVDTIAAAHHELHRDLLGSTARATLRGDFDAAGRARAAAHGVQVEPVSLQQLVVRLTTAAEPAPVSVGAVDKELSR